MTKHIFQAAVCGALIFFAQGSWAANLNITETNTGVVMSGDNNFTNNDWGGLLSSTQTGTDNAHISARLFNPNGFAGSELIGILDPDGLLSDVLSLSFSNGIFTADFCSTDNGNVCVTTGFTTTISEDALGNFNVGSPTFDPNMSIQGLSIPSRVPEPSPLALLSLGLVGLVASRRRKG